MFPTRASSLDDVTALPIGTTGGPASDFQLIHGLLASPTMANTSLATTIIRPFGGTMDRPNSLAHLRQGWAPKQMVSPPMVPSLLVTGTRAAEPAPSVGLQQRE